ncbi:MAG TPA: hypothetical protein VF941_24870, partial [Clostridia bacterium]
ILSCSTVSNAGGLAASQGRLMFLNQRKSDIEFKIQVINQRRSLLAEQSAQLTRLEANSLYQDDSGTKIILLAEQSNSAIQNYSIQMAQIQALDKELELRENDLNTQHKKVEAELDSVKKIIDRNIDKTFKMLG